MMGGMKHDFRKQPEGEEADRFLAWLEEQTISCLKRSVGDFEALKGCIFLYVNRPYEGKMPEDQILALFVKAFVRAGWPEEAEEAAFDCLDFISQIVAPTYRDTSPDDISN
jgi:hypothetical protein